MPVLPGSLLAKTEGCLLTGIFQDNLDKSTWHYHNNYEISFITEGAGKRIVGDSIEEFQPGDLVFLGKNLPHVWIAEKDQGIWANRTLEMVYLLFTSDVISQQLFLLPEFSHVQKALVHSEQGIQVTMETLNEVSALMLQMPYLKGIDRVLYLFKILDLIGNSRNLKPLASKDYLKTRFTTGNKRIAAIHDYLMKHYREEVNLRELSGIVNLAEGSLCRFFKQKMGITLFEYLHKIKVEFACKLLMDPDLSVLDVCLDSGFNNVSHFNRKFRQLTGVTPIEYRKRIINLT